MAASISSRKSNDSVISSVRAILHSRKGFATAKEIRKDYEGLEGELPFSNKSLEDLLKGSRNDFTFQNVGGEIKFNAKVEVDASHKQNSQNGAKKKNVSLPRSVKPDHENGTSWRSSNSTAYSQMYSDLPRSKPSYNNYNGNKPRNGNKFNNNNNNNGQMRNKNPSDKNPSGPLSPSHNGNQGNNNYNNGSKRNDWRNAPEKTDPKPQETDLRNKLNPPNGRSALNAITNQNGLQSAPAKKSMNDRLVAKAPTAELPKLQITSLADRLNKARTFNDQEFAQSAPSTPNVGWDLGPTNDTTKLEMYCKANGYDAPEYKFFAVKDKLQVIPRIDCRLTVNDKIYSCYPSSFASELEAKFGVSKIAVESIQSQEQFLKYPLDKDTDYEIAYKIFEMIKQFPSGCFKKSIKELYISSYKLSLPQEWFEMIYEQIGKLFEVSSEDNESQCIILAITSSTPIEPPSSPNSFSDKPTIPHLKFPFDESHWNLFVMNPLSTNQVFARLIGTNFSDQLDVLLTEIEMKFHATTPARPVNINTNTTYLCSIADCWHRIRVIHTEHDQAYCFCIDNGEFEWISIQEIYVCDSEFLQLAAQAFEISMFGLEDFEQNPDSRQILDQCISYKSLIGEIISTRADHEKNPEGSLKVILFDTSGEDDVNLNETIVHKILSSTPLPSLSLHQQNHVVITHVGDFIYCQIKQSFSYIEQLIHNLMKSKFNKKEHQGLYKDNSDTKKLYLVFDPKRKKWYRARLVAGRADACKMSFVDFGLIDDVDKVNIYRLDKISIALSLYPAQSIKVGLAGVKMTEDVRKQLRALLPGNKEAFAKVSSSVNGLPQVLLYVHIIHNNAQLLIKVNDTFHLEKDIQPKESSVEASKTNGQSVRSYYLPSKARLITAAPQ